MVGVAVVRPEDLNPFLKDALSRFEPTSEQEREKIDRLRAIMEEGATQVSNVMSELGRLPGPVPAGQAELLEKTSAEQQQFAEETFSLLAQMFDQQTAIIDRILR